MNGVVFISKELQHSSVVSRLEHVPSKGIRNGENDGVFIPFDDMGVLKPSSKGRFRD